MTTVVDPVVTALLGSVVVVRVGDGVRAGVGAGVAVSDSKVTIASVPV
jgi:hypothetical protein